MIKIICFHIPNVQKRNIKIRKSYYYSVRIFKKKEKLENQNYHYLEHELFCKETAMNRSMIMVGLRMRSKQIIPLVIKAGHTIMSSTILVPWWVASNKDWMSLI